MLMKQLFGASLDNILDILHLNRDEFNTHSFCIGAATSTNEADVDDLFIKMLDCLCSNTYQKYITTPSKKLAQLSKTLARIMHIVGALQPLLDIIN